MGVITGVCPLFPARDPAASAAWYCDRLGFRLIAVHGAEYALVERDGFEVHFWKSDDRHLAENTSAYFRTGNANALHAAMLRASDGGRIEAPDDCAWGMREFYVWDPDGNLLKFGEMLKS